MHLLPGSFMPSLSYRCPFSEDVSCHREEDFRQARLAATPHVHKSHLSGDTVPDHHAAAPPRTRCLLWPSRRGPAPLLLLLPPVLATGFFVTPHAPLSTNEFADYPTIFLSFPNYSAPCLMPFFHAETMLPSVVSV